MDNSPNKNNDDSSSFGIKKIVDCKVMNGQQMYKVKWEPTWEPAENLETCKHLVDEFWSRINKVQHLHEKAKLFHSKFPKLESNATNNGDIHIHRLTDDNKANIENLITRTNNSIFASNNILSPSDMLTMTTTNDNNNMYTYQNDNQKSSLKQNKTKDTLGKLPDLSSSPSSGKIGASGLKYIENFDNPYVKIIVVCKVCNKEQSLKQSGHWKQHFLTHSDQKPHTCTLCGKGFLLPYRLRAHMEKKHNNANIIKQPDFPKQEDQFPFPQHF